MNFLEERIVKDGEQFRHTRGIFSAQCRQQVQLAEHANTESAEKHQSFMLLFQSSFTSILIAAMTSSNDCFFSE